MKNNILIYLLGIMLLAGCSKDEENKYISFALDTEHNSVEGSYVLGAPLLPTCQAAIGYVNAEGGSVVLSSEEVNGIRIEKTTVSVEGKTGTIKLPIVGVPNRLGIMYLPISVEYMGNKYETSVSVVIFEDTDPSGSIEFQMSENPVVDMNSVIEIPFTVTPTMAAITFNDDEFKGVIAKVTQDVKTGQGIIKLTPTNELLSGALKVTASFGVRTSVEKTIEMNAFTAGDGTVDNPYLITEIRHLSKLYIGLDKAFKLSKDFEVQDGWKPVGTSATPFAGALDGDGHTITYHINAPASDNQAFFGYLAAGAKVKNLTLAGDVVGRTVVAGFAANSEAVLTGCNADNVMVKGENTLATLVAAGTKKDSRILTVGASFPTMINIVQPTTSASQSLDVLPKDAKVTVLTNATGATISYDSTTGNLTADISQGGFTPGNITLSLQLANSGSGSKVTSVTKVIEIQSKKMYESGTGVSNDPYIVMDGDQLSATITNYPASYIALKNNIQLTGNWKPVSVFTGNLDGKGYTVNGLKINATVTNSGWVMTNNGTIHDLKFTGVDVTASVAFGTIAGINNGVIRNVEVSGTINSTNTGDVLGGIAGENQQAGVIDNCLVNAQITATCGMVGGIVGRNKGTGATVQNCTSQGSITVTGAKTRIAGIVGRGEGSDLIKGCLSSMNITATTSGANGVGGIFGANNNDLMKIEECMFTGTVKSGNDVGGIAGVGVNVKNCLVESATITNMVAGTNGNAGGICGTNKKYAQNCIVRLSTIEGVVGTGRAAAGINSNYQNNGTTNRCVVESTTIKGAKVQRISAVDPTAVASPGAALTNNWTCGVTLLDGTGADMSATAVDNPAGLDGGKVETTALTESWYTALGFDASIWTWKDGKLTLKNVGYKAK